MIVSVSRKDEIWKNVVNSFSFVNNKKAIASYKINIKLVQDVIRKPYYTPGYNYSILYRVDIKMLIQLLLIISIGAYTALLPDEYYYTETI